MLANRLALSNRLVWLEQPLVSKWLGKTLLLERHLVKLDSLPKNVVKLLLRVQLNKADWLASLLRHKVLDDWVRKMQPWKVRDSEH